MRIDVVTIFPEMFGDAFGSGMIRKAVEDGRVRLDVHDLRSWTTDRHRTTDDYAFGGGPGMLMKPEPVFAAVAGLRGPGARVVLMSPQGRAFDQSVAREFSGLEQLVLVCGRYEGVDERVRLAVCDDELSIGDYVLTGGEVPAMVVIDAVVRLLPGVLAQGSAEADSFSEGLLEGPQYTRPREFCGLAVPEVLLSGDHAAIARWRRKESLRRTWRRRPDLLQRLSLSGDDRRLLAEVLAEEGDGEGASDAHPMV